MYQIHSENIQRGSRTAETGITLGMHMDVAMLLFESFHFLQVHSLTYQYRERAGEDILTCRCMACIFESVVACTWTKTFVKVCTSISVHVP